MRGSGEWVSVKEAMPELEYIDILLWPEQDFTYGSNHIASFENGEFYISCEDSHSCWDEKAVGVTHWMYFPAGPDD